MLRHLSSKYSVLCKHGDIFRVIALLVITLLLAGIVSCQSTNKIQRLAFITQQNDQSALYMIQDDRSGPNHISDRIAWYRIPKWSPDGSKLAMVIEADGRHTLQISDRSGRLTSPITIDLDVRSFDWSPSGEEIAFSAVSKDGNEDIYVIHLDPYSLSNLTAGNGRANIEPTWSHNGKHIAFLSTQDVNGTQECGDPGCLYRIYVIENTGADILPIDEKSSVLDPHASQCMPDWSPDDKHLTFTHGCYVSEPAIRIYRYDFDTSRVSQLTTGKTIDRWSHWLSNEELLFRTFREGAERYYVMGPNGKSPHPFVAWKIDDINSLSWTKDRHWFAWSTENDHEIMIGNFLTGQMTQTATMGCNPQWSPSGTQIAYSTDCLESTNEDIGLMDRDTLQHMNLTASLEGKKTQPIWAP